jgi:nitroreductase
MGESIQPISSTMEHGSQDERKPTSTSGADNTLTSLMRTRHSVRTFLPNPVPRDLLHDVFSLAQQTSSNSNCQPWRLKILTGSALQRLSSALLDAVKAGADPTTAPIPEHFKHYRSEFGHMLYGPEGYDIARGNKEAMETARRRNYAFFDAPVGMVVYMDRSLADVDVMCVGMYMQSVSLLLGERGVACCWQVSVAGYPDVVRRELGIGGEMVVLSGGAVGYEDVGARPNAIRSSRDAWGDHVEFVE